MIRIALVSSYTLPFYCGNSILVERLREGLTKRGYDVAIFNATKDDPDLASKFSPDIVHSFNASRPYKWMCDFRNSQSIPWIITLTGTDYNTWCNIAEPAAHIKESLIDADTLVVFHDEAQRSLCTSLPRIRNKIIVIKQGVTFLRTTHDAIYVREKHGIDHDQTVFLMVSGLRPVKNIGCALEAFCELEYATPNIKLLLVGPIIDREEANRVLKLGKQLSCFSYLGELPYLEVRKLMKAADVFLNTSFHEGMSGAILEAMTAGLPVLASSTTGNRSLVKDSINGLLFPANERQALTRAALKLISNLSLRKKMGKASKDLVVQNHSQEKELDCYEDVYLRALQKEYDTNHGIVSYPR